MNNTKLWSSAILMGGCFILILLGGCFLIGVMLMVSPSSVCLSTTSPVEFTIHQQIFLTILYGLAFSCFGCSVNLLLLSLRGLQR